MLKKLFIDNDLVLCNYDAEDWVDAVTTSVHLLENNGFVEKGVYLESIFKNVEKNGPYFVIAPEIAIPHSRPEDGVNDVAISIVTLKTPINFNHEDNDPVKIVIALAAKDGKTHIELMKQVAQILFDDTNIESIKNSSNNEELKSCLLNML